MIVREARSTDTPTILDFQLKMALETENVQLEIRTLSQGVGRLFKDPTKGRYYVAEERGEVVGCLMTTFEWSDWRNGTFLWIQSVYVPIHWRKKGVFSKMYDHVQAIVNDDPDLMGLRLYVDQKNNPAHATYSSLGMNGAHYKVFEWIKE